MSPATTAPLTVAAVSSIEFAGGADVVYVANGGGFADALSGGPAAGVAGGPVLLVGGNDVPDATQDELSRLQPSQIVILGGPGAVGAGVEATLHSFAPNVRRIGGGDRYETSALVSAATFAVGAPAVYLAAGTAFPDALAGGPAAFHDGGPVLLVERDCIPPAVNDEIDRLGAQQVVILGGLNAISDAVARDRTECRPRPVLPPDDGGSRFHVVYAVPADVVPNPQITPAAKYELGLVYDWFKAQMVSQIVRFERDTDGSVAIKTVVLRSTRAQVEQRGFSGIVSDLSAAGEIRPGMFTIAYVEARGGACGETREVTALWMPACNIYPHLDTPGFPYGASYLVAHEMAHALGAAPKCAPHDDGSGHISDDNHDLLYQGPSPRDWDHLVLDPGHDDYFRHSIPNCADVEDSPLLQRI